MSNLLVLAGSSFIVLIGCIVWWKWGIAAILGPDEGEVGTITKVSHTTVDFGRKEVTVLEILTEGNYPKTHHLSVVGHAFEMQMGTRIQFWRTNNSLGLDYNVRVKQNTDGTISRLREKVIYFELKKYRILTSESEK